MSARIEAASNDEATAPLGDRDMRGGRQTKQFGWGAVAGRFLHRVQMQIIEAMLWIDQPLSAAELTQIFDRDPTLSAMSRHVRRLAGLNVIVLDRTRKVRGATESFYRLATEPQEERSEEGSDGEGADEATQGERLVLQEVLDLHPDHLTILELTLKLSVIPEDRAEAEAIKHAIRDLMASGLLRYVDGVIEPTYAAIRARVLGI